MSITNVCQEPVSPKQTGLRVTTDDQTRIRKVNGTLYTK